MVNIGIREAEVSDMVWVWAVVAAVALGLELVTATFYLGLVAVGAVAGVITAAVGAPVLVQGGVVASVSLAGILFVRPVAARHMHRMPMLSRTGVDALKGMEAVTMTEINSADGRIRLNGEVWSSRLDRDLSDEVIPAGARVCVSRIDGATALVYPLDY